MQVSVYGEFEENSHPTREEILAILDAGSARLVPFSQASTAGLTFAVTRASRTASDPKIKQLVSAGVCIVAPAFVVQWLAHPWQIPKKARHCCINNSLLTLKSNLMYLMPWEASLSTHGSKESRGSNHSEVYSSTLFSRGCV